MSIEQERLEAEYRDSNRSAAWLEASLLVGALALTLTVLYLCGAFEWIAG